MGLLNDAIREHLELKRLRGADPGLVAHEEHEALGPVRGGEPADADGEAMDHDHDVAAHDGGLGEESVQPAEDDPGQASQDGEAQAFSNVGQETAELDMRTVLGENPGHDGAPVGPAAIGPVGGRVSPEEDASAEQRDDDPLELEPDMPSNGESDDTVARGHANDDLRASVPDQHDDWTQDQSDEPGEDVPEETTDRTADRLGDTP